VEDGPAAIVVHLTTPFPDDGAVLLSPYGPLPPTIGVVAARPQIGTRVEDAASRGSALRGTVSGYEAAARSALRRGIIA
jgi:hypothetical protein